MPPEHPPLSGDVHPASPPRSIRRFPLPAGVLRLLNFGAVGGIAFVVDIGIYNLLRATLLDDKPIGAKVVSVIVATAVAWIGNRQFTFRSERSRPVLREAFLFGVMNVIGLGIAAACLFLSHYVLGFTSQLADNISGNGVGLVAGMVFRFLAYRHVVFRQDSATPSDPARDLSTSPIPAARSTPHLTSVTPASH